MNLVKWFRKNKPKALAIVTIITLAGFMGVGTLLQQMTQRAGEHKTIAYFLDNRKITTNDMRLGQRELDTLKMLRANELLKRIPTPLSRRTPDLQALLLGEILFSEQASSPASSKYIKSLIRSGNYNISDEQINDIYERSMADKVYYWLLLKNEAQLAGIRVSNKQAGRQLAGAISLLFESLTYQQLMWATMGQRKMSEKDILRTFGRLLAVLQYANMVCSSEDVTSSQARHNVSWEEERVDVEFVKLDSSVFAETQDEPSEEKMTEHFEKYKTFIAGDISEENPCGFGYKLPDRAGLEYIAVKMDDIAAVVAEPNYDRVEEYHGKHRKEFFEYVPSDPNDPNSPLTERLQSCGEVAEVIIELLRQKDIDLKANTILQQAKTLTEAGLEDAEPENLSSEQFRQMGGDYRAAAEQASKEHKAKVYAGQTGLLSAADIDTDEYLRRLYVEGYGHNPPAFFNKVPLSKIVFSIDELGTSELGPFDTSKPRMYENIGPMKDKQFVFSVGLEFQVDLDNAIISGKLRQEFKNNKVPLSEHVSVSVKEAGSRWVIIDKYRRYRVWKEADKLNIYDEQGQITAIMRVIEARKASVPESINQTYDNHALELEQEPNQISENVYSVKEKVAEDMKKLAAMDTTKAKTKEFIKQIVTDGWDDAIDKFNKLYGQDKQDEKEPNVFTLQEAKSVRRFSRQTMAAWTTQYQGSPVEHLLVNEAKIRAELIDRLYSLVPPDSNSLETVPFILEFEPHLSCYCLKSLSIKRLNRNEYEQIKSFQFYKDDIAQSQNLAAVHFNPQNILKRMNFRPAKEVGPKDANTPTESNGT